MKKAFREFYEDIGSKKAYWIPIILLAVGAYGFSLTCRTVSVDDLRAQFYQSPDYYLISGGYWGYALCQWLLGTYHYAPFFTKFASVLLYILNGYVFGTVLHQLNGRKGKLLPYLLLTGAMITFPLISEIWEYHGSALGYFVPMLMIFLSCLVFETEQDGKKKYLYASLLLAAAECIDMITAFVYMAVVCMILFYRYAVNGREDHPKWKWILEGLAYVPQLAVAVAVRLILQVVLQKITGTSFDPTIDVRIDMSPLSILKAIAYNGFSYGFESLLYQPILIFDLACLAFLVISIIRCRKMHSPVPILISICILLCLFSQSILQGRRLNFRHALGICIFIGFVFFLVMERIEENPRVLIRRTAAVVLLLVCWNQASYLSRMLELNNLRSENELAVIRQLGYELRSKYDKKPVAFVGGGADCEGWPIRHVSLDPGSLGGKLAISTVNSLGRFLPEDQGIREDLDRIESLRYTQTNVQSVIQWSLRSPDMIGELFSYCGYDLDIVEFDENYQLFSSLWQQAVDADLGLYEIMDTGDYLIVSMGRLDAPH